MYSLFILKNPVLESSSNIINIAPLQLKRDTLVDELHKFEKVIIVAVV